MFQTKYIKLYDNASGIRTTETERTGSSKDDIITRDSTSALLKYEPIRNKLRVSKHTRKIFYIKIRLDVIIDLFRFDHSSE